MNHSKRKDKRIREKALRQFKNPRSYFLYSTPYYHASPISHKEITKSTKAYIAIHITSIIREDGKSLSLKKLMDFEIETFLSAIIGAIKEIIKENPQDKKKLIKLYEEKLIKLLHRIKRNILISIKASFLIAFVLWYFLAKKGLSNIEVINVAPRYIVGALYGLLKPKEIVNLLNYHVLVFYSFLKAEDVRLIEKSFKGDRKFKKWRRRIHNQDFENKKIWQGIYYKTAKYVYEKLGIDLLVPYMYYLVWKETKERLLKAWEEIKEELLGEEDEVDQERGYENRLDKKELESGCRIFSVNRERGYPL